MTAPSVAVPTAKDPRDQAFLEYWGRVIDWSDPAAPHWLAHFEQRVAECNKIADTMEAYRPFKDARALDIGCQTGALACVMAERGAKVTGIEPEAWVLEAAKRRASGWGVQAEFLVSGGEALPFEDASFDVVSFVDVIEHCRDATACLTEIARVLAPGGVAYILGPNRFAPEWFVSDPHYKLVGASAMPYWMGKRYVEWRRGKKGYDVGVFPVGARVGRTLRREGLELLDSPVTRAEAWMRARVPEGVARVAAPIARAWGQVRFAFIPTFTIVARRP